MRTAYKSAPPAPTSSTRPPPVWSGTMTWSPSRTSSWRTWSGTAGWRRRSRTAGGGPSGKCSRTRRLGTGGAWSSPTGGPPSSKTCSACGYVLADLSLKIRMWQCPSCGTRHDRDHNAAKNILAAGLAV